MRKRLVIPYRFAHLLLPLQHVRHGMIARELDVAVEDDTLPENRSDVRRFMVVDSAGCRGGEKDTQLGQHSGPEKFK